MAGPRYTDWTSIHVAGDQPELGAPYIPQARKLLGYVMSTGLGTASLQRELEDGTVLVAEKFGDIPRITIYPVPPGGRKRPIRLLDDLVLDPGAAGVSGDDRTVPPVIAQPDKDLNWKSNFFKSSSPGYFEGAGTYNFIYNKADKLSSGHLAPASRTWVNADGERIAYTSVFPYWAAPYRHPDSLYARGVVHLGFDMKLAQYETSDGDPLDEDLVVGAAMKDGWLYAVMIEGIPLNYLTRPSSPSTAFQVWASDPFSTDSIRTVLRRFKLKVKTEDKSGVQHYVVVNGSHEDLWSDDLIRSYAPWVFNEDVSEVVTYQIPDSVVCLWEGGEAGTGPSRPLSTGGADRLSIAIDTEAGSASFSSAAAGDAVAEDNGVVLRIERISGADYDFVWGPHRAIAQRWTGTNYKVRALAYIDLRTGWAIFHETEATYSGAITPEFVQYDPEDPLYHHGLVETWQKRAIVYDPTTATETEIGTQPVMSFTHPTFLGVRQFGLLEEFTDMATSNPSSLALFYAVRLGVTFSAEKPAGGGIIGYTSSFSSRDFSHIILSIDASSGTSNGGFSGCQPVNDADLPLVWNAGLTAGYAPGNSVAPYHTDTNTIYIHAGSATGEKWAAYSGKLSAPIQNPLGAPSGLTPVLVNYITGGDIVSITGGGFPDDFVAAMYVLGNPIKTQPKERD